MYWVLRLVNYWLYREGCLVYWDVGWWNCIDGWVICEFGIGVRWSFVVLV